MIFGRNSFMNFLLPLTSLKLTINMRKNLKVWPDKIIETHRKMSKGDVQGSFQNFEHVFCTYATNKVIRQIFVTRQSFGTGCLRSFAAETFLGNATKNNIRGTLLSITHHNLLLIFMMLFFILRTILGDSYVRHENNIR